MEVLGVILARGGSKGLSNKHLLPLLGRPVIDYTLDHAQASRGLSDVVLSSDCPAIRDLGRRRGLTTIDRPAALATDDASVQDVLLHALHVAETNSFRKFDAVVTLYGNVPVRPAGVIDQAVALLHDTGCDSVRSFCPVGKWHPAWMSRLNGDHVQALHPGSIHRRQDLEPLCLHDGAVVAVSRASLLRGLEWPGDPHAFFGVDRRGIRTAEGETVEIDARRDLYHAEAILRDAADLQPLAPHVLTPTATARAA